MTVKKHHYLLGYRFFWSILCCLSSSGGPDFPNTWTQAPETQTQTAYGYHHHQGWLGKCRKVPTQYLLPQLPVGYSRVLTTETVSRRAVLLDQTQSPSIRAACFPTEANQKPLGHNQGTQAMNLSRCSSLATSIPQHPASQQGCCIQSAWLASISSSMNWTDLRFQPSELVTISASGGSQFHKLIMPCLKYFLSSARNLLPISCIE